MAGLVFLFPTALAAQVGSPPPAVGVITAEYKPMTEAMEINGRIQAPQRVDLVARVTAFLNEQLFVEGADVKKGDLLYRLERAPFEADVEAKQAAVALARTLGNICEQASGAQGRLLTCLATNCFNWRF